MVMLQNFCLLELWLLKSRKFDKRKKLVGWLPYAIFQKYIVLPKNGFELFPFLIWKKMPRFERVTLVYGWIVICEKYSIELNLKATVNRYVREIIFSQTWFTVGCVYIAITILWSKYKISKQIHITKQNVWRNGLKL